MVVRHFFLQYYVPVLLVRLPRLILALKMFCVRERRLQDKGDRSPPLSPSLTVLHTILSLLRCSNTSSTVISITVRYLREEVKDSIQAPSVTMAVIPWRDTLMQQQNGVWTQKRSCDSRNCELRCDSNDKRNNQQKATMEENGGPKAQHDGTSKRRKRKSKFGRRKRDRDEIEAVIATDRAKRARDGHQSGVASRVVDLNDGNNDNSNNINNSTTNTSKGTNNTTNTSKGTNNTTNNNNETDEIINNNNEKVANTENRQKGTAVSALERAKEKIRERIPALLETIEEWKIKYVLFVVHSRQTCSYADIHKSLQQTSINNSANFSFWLFQTLCGGKRCNFILH